MQPTWLVLLPPVFVLISAMITRRLPLSLVIGLIFGGLIAKRFDFIQAFSLLAKRLFNQIIDIENLFVYTFLLCVGILIVIINYMGAASAFAYHLKKRIKTAKNTENFSFFLSLLLALDDYLNSLTVGYVMRPLTDSFGIARTKLAYLVHSFAGPLVILIPISTWATFITSQLDHSGIAPIAGPSVKIIADPFYVYIQSIPFIFYAILTIITAFIIINWSISYGPMHQFEHAAKEDIVQSTEKIETEQPKMPADGQAGLIDLFGPFFTLLVTVLLGIMYAGGYWLFGGQHTLLEAFRSNQQPFSVLGIASIITVFVSLMLAYMRKQIHIAQMPHLVWQGILLMGPAVLLVILASTLGTILRVDLQTGQYLASLILHNVTIAYLPLIFFIVSVITSSLIGTAWGTIALLLPIGIPMTHSLLGAATPALINEMTILIPTIGAILAGATFGDHISPIAAAGIMSATSSGCKPIDHIQTQFPYAMPPLVGSIAAFFTTGMLFGSHKITIISISLSVGIVTCITLLFLNHLLYHKKSL